MCSGTDYSGWMCDECFANTRENSEAELCDTCKEMACKICKEEPTFEKDWCKYCDGNEGTCEHCGEPLSEHDDGECPLPKDIEAEVEGVPV